jgi:hypothetical protein
MAFCNTPGAAPLIWEFWIEGLPEMQVDNYEPHEKPSGNANLHYNGPTLTLTMAASGRQLSSCRTRIRKTEE